MQDNKSRSNWKIQDKTTGKSFSSDLIIANPNRLVTRMRKLKVSVIKAEEEANFLKSI